MATTQLAAAATAQQLINPSVRVNQPLLSERPAVTDRPLKNNETRPSSSAAPPASGFARSAALSILGLAATLLVIVGWRATHGGLDRVSPQVAATVDYEDVFRLFEQQPNLAIDALTRRYEGQEVSTDQAEALLGYRPSIAGGLPAHARLVSTRVLKLPQCRCADGKCTCGPGECNCTACLCQRPDGSQFVVFEQCKTQAISFGDLPRTSARHDSREVQLIKSHDRLGATWINGGRRLTAIGLKDEAEAKTLIASLDGQAPAPANHSG
jgi:hypothetical protein